MGVEAMGPCSRRNEPWRGRGSGALASAEPRPPRPELRDVELLSGPGPGALPTEKETL